MSARKATHIVWHAGRVTRAKREGLSGHRGFTIWFTGLSASGKSTLAVAMEEALYEHGCHAYMNFFQFTSSKAAEYDQVTFQGSWPTAMT